MPRTPLILAFTLLAGLLARRASAADYTLAAVLDSAWRRADEITIADLQYRAGLEEVTTYRAAAMPMVDYTTGVNYVGQSMAQSFSMGQYAEIIGDHLTGAQLSWNLSVRQPLVTFGRVSSALKIAKVRDSMLVDSRQLSHDLFAFEVTRAWVEAYLAQHREKVAGKALQQAEKLQTRLEVDVSTGAASRTDKLRVDAQVKAKEAALLSATSGREVAVRRLCDLAEMQSADPLALVLEDGGLPFDEPGKATRGIGLEASLLRYKASMYEHNIKGDRSALLPSIYLVGSLFNDYMIPDTSGMTEKWNAIPAVPGQPKEFPIEVPKVSDYFSPDYWGFAVGLQLSWTIFDGRRSWATYRKTRIEAEKADREYEKKLEQNAASIREARDALKVLTQNAEAARLQLSAARSAYEQAQRDYESGSEDITTLLAIEAEMLGAELAVEELRANRLLAIATLRLALGLPVYEGQS